MILPNITGSKATLKGNGTLYACTLKYNGRVKKKNEQLYKLLHFLKNFPWKITNLRHELDDSDNHHYHFVFMAPKNLTYKDLMQLNYHVFIKPIYKLSGWVEYIKKEDNASYLIQKSQRLTEKYYKKHYGFRTISNAPPRGKGSPESRSEKRPLSK